MTVQLRRLFATAPSVTALGMVRCGFELETQSVNGMTYGELEDAASETVFNEDAYTSELEARFQRAWTSSALTERLAGDRGTGTLGSMPMTERIWNLTQELAPFFDADLLRGRVLFSTVLLVLPESRRAEVQPLLDEAEAELRRMAGYYVSRNDYMYRAQIGPHLGLPVPDGVEAKSDGSVEGPEFVVSGRGCTASDFSRRLRGLLQSVDVEVDEGCSFHIHISVPGIHHSYGKRFQASMYEYLLTQLHRVPASVRSRWMGDTNYFRPILDEDKYRFVHFHSALRTWEFRCFGNISSHKEGMRCLQLAVEALQFAYRVQLGLQESELEDTAQWNESILGEVLGYSDAPQTVSGCLKKRRMRAA